MYEKNLTDEQKMQNPQIVVMFRQNKYDEKMREVKEYYERGLAQEEIISRMLEGNTADISTNRRILCKEDIIEFFEQHPRQEETNQDEQQENSSTETTDEETKKEEKYELDLDDTEVDEQEAEKEATTEETELLLIDTNIATRKDLDIISKAKVLKRKKDILDNKNFRARIENLKQEAQGKEGTEKIIPVLDSLKEEFNISKGNIQRYLRLAVLSPDLQEQVKENRINAKVGEQLSFLSNPKQKIISKMMLQNEKLKISESQAKKIKVMANEKDISKEDLEGILLKTKKQDDTEIIKYKIEFSEEEIKSLTDKLLEETKEITDENIKQKFLELLKFL